MRRRFVVVAGTMTALGMMGGTAFAEPPAPTVGPHQHFVVTEGAAGNVVAGPDACEDGMSIQFDNFHNNVHRGEPGGNGVVIATGCPS